MRQLIFLVVLAACTAVLPAAPPAKPHLLYIVADDLGYADVGFHDSEIKTPHLDQLAAGGARLEQFYVQPVCSPTRASLMTGRYPFRYGLQVGVVRPHADYGLPLEERTLATALHEAGYATHIVGKWHLGIASPAYLPTSRGFDHHYGHYLGALDYNTHMRDGGLDWHRDGKPLREEGYTTDLMGAEAQRIIREHDPAKPLFLYLPFNAVHSPLQAPREYLDQYAHITDPKRRAYAAMTTCMDDNVGRIVAALDARGMRDKTLILFHSDNGGPVNLGATNTPLRGAKGTLYEGGVRVTALANWPGVIKPGSVVTGLMHAVDMYPTLIHLAGASLDQKLPLDGMDVWPVIADGAPSPRTQVFHNITPTGGAVRVGDWKLIAHPADADGDDEGGAPKSKKAAKKKGGGKNKAAGVELFNIALDPNEQKNLAAEEPQRVAELMAILKTQQAAQTPPRNKPAPKGWKPPAIWGEFPAN